MPQKDVTVEITNPLKPAQLGVLVGSLLLGLLAAQLLAPSVFRASPTDLNRNGYLLDILQSPEHQPEKVVLGNSITMQGVDTRVISDNLPGKPTIYNLATTGQGLTEANLFFSVLPDSVDTVIHVFYVNQLENIDLINEQKLNAMHMFGFRIDEALEEELKSIYTLKKSVDLLEQSGASHAFQSRWALRQALDTVARNTLRKDMALDSITTNLYFPSPMQSRLPPAKMKKNLADTFRGKDKPNFTPFWSPKQHLDSFMKQVQASGRRYVMVIAPLNPAGESYVAPDRYEVAEEVLTEITERNGVLLINAMNLLEESDFADALHPTPAGAEILSRYIAEQLALHPQPASSVSPGGAGT